MNLKFYVPQVFRTHLLVIVHEGLILFSFDSVSRLFLGKSFILALGLKQTNKQTRKSLIAISSSLGGACAVTLADRHLHGTSSLGALIGKF